MEQFLTDDFLSQYPDFAPQQSEISKFVYLRTYSRYLKEKKRREVWRETPARALNFNMNLEYQHRVKKGLPIDFERMQAECEEIYDNVYNLRQFPSGRTMWVGGADGAIGEKYALANFNCSFTNVEEWKDLAEIFYLLLVGTGVGFKTIFELIWKLPPIRNDIEVTHETYETLYPGLKIDETSLLVSKDVATIQVGDSKEGWVDALFKWLELHTSTKYSHVKKLNINYNFVRPAGSRLKTFGGTASGPEPLIEMFTTFSKVVRNEIDPYLAPPQVVALDKRWVYLRPIHILDMANAIGYNVVVGGVRRTSEINLFSWNDIESLFAKYGINGFWTEEQFERHRKIKNMLIHQGIPIPGWWDKLAVKEYCVFYGPGGKEKKWFGEDKDGAHAFAKEFEGYVHFPANPGRDLPHRRMSNNSIAFTTKPQRDFLSLVFEIMQGEGEPGFVNLRELAIRRLHAMGISNPSELTIQQMMLKIGLNPCGEVNLRSKGVCNLTTVNATAYVRNGKLDLEGFLRAQRLSARIGLRMTLIELELPEWNKIQQEDRLLGCSLTGWKDAMEQLGYSRNEERQLLQLLHMAARQEANDYADELGVNRPLMVTTVKPEGTQSQVAVNLFGSPVSSGLHYGHAPYYIRRVRVNSHDPVVKTALATDGWVINPEYDTLGDTFEERMTNARTLVVDFPVASGAKRTKDDVSVEEQFQTYFDFQSFYTEHNSSNTITINPEKNEWSKAEEIVWNNWDRFAAVSFLQLDGGTYSLMPYETCTKEQYLELRSKMKPFDFELLKTFEDPDVESVLTDDDCAGGACGPR